MKRTQKKSRGFTLVEVVVVLVILAILAAIMIPAMVGWIEKSRAYACIHEMGQVRRDYLAQSANTGYGMYTALNKAELLKGAVQDVQDKAAVTTGESSYTGSCGNTCAVEYTYSDGLPVAIASIICPEHGKLEGTSNWLTVNGGGPNSAIQTAIKDAITNATNPAGGATTFRNGIGVDSTAPGSAARLAAVLAQLKAAGVNLNDTGIVSWAVLNETGQDKVSDSDKLTMIWSDQDVTDTGSIALNRTQVRVLQYTPETGAYQIGYRTVQNRTTTVAGKNETYRAFKDGSFQEDSSYATYEEALAAFAALDAIKNP